MINFKILYGIEVSATIVSNISVKDILIMCCDGLTGIKDAITTAFSKTIQQRCVVHIIRNSVRFVYWKDLKPFCNDLKTIYTAKNKKAGYDQLQKVKKKWKTNTQQP